MLFLRLPKLHVSCFRRNWNLFPPNNTGRKVKNSKYIANCSCAEFIHLHIYMNCNKNPCSKISMLRKRSKELARDCHVVLLLSKAVLYSFLKCWMTTTTWLRNRKATTFLLTTLGYSLSPWCFLGHSSTGSKPSRRWTTAAKR